VKATLIADGGAAASDEENFFRSPAFLEAEEATHTVEAGDTLSLIARKYYGTQLKWEKIYQANKSTMKHPDYIYVGQKIIIPS